MLQKDFIMIQRALEKKLLSDIKPQKVVLLLGARRVGKTVLMEKLIREYGDGVVFLNGEDYATVEMLSARTISSYKQLFQGVKLLAIDEAQNIPHIGNILKLIIDHIEGLSVIVSGHHPSIYTIWQANHLWGAQTTICYIPFL